MKMLVIMLFLSSVSLSASQSDEIVSHDGKWQLSALTDRQKKEQSITTEGDFVYQATWIKQGEEQEKYPPTITDNRGKIYVVMANESYYIFVTKLKNQKKSWKD